MCFVSAPPPGEFREGKQRGDGEDEDSPFAAAGGTSYILGFGFCWGMISWVEMKWKGRAEEGRVR